LASQPDLAKFTGERIKQVVSKRSWDIKFATGSAKFKPEAVHDLKAMFADLVVAGGTIVEVHGHTDDQGALDKNQRLSEALPCAAKRGLEAPPHPTPPAGRKRLFPPASPEPLAPTAPAEGRAKNRRVEITLGTGTQT